MKKATPPKGYRVLEDGDAVQAGDLIFSGEGWYTNFIAKGLKWDSRIHNPFCRKISPRTTVTRKVKFVDQEILTAENKALLRRIKELEGTMRKVYTLLTHVEKTTM